MPAAKTIFIQFLAPRPGSPAWEQLLSELFPEWIGLFCHRKNVFSLQDGNQGLNLVIIFPEAPIYF